MCALTRRTAVQRFKKEFTAAYRTPGWLLAYQFYPDEETIDE